VKLYFELMQTRTQLYALDMMSEACNKGDGLRSVQLEQYFKASIAVTTDYAKSMVEFKELEHHFKLW